MVETTMNQCGAAPAADSDTELLGRPDFFHAWRTSREQQPVRDWYYRQADTGRVFMIKVDTDALADDVLDSEEGDGVAEDIDQQVSLDRGLQIVEVSAAALERADPVGLDEMRPTLADWLVAAADAIDEADGVPEDVTPPIPAAALH